MTDLRKAAEMALEALENHSGNYKLSKTECVHHNAAVEALRQALAQPEQDISYTDIQMEELIRWGDHIRSLRTIEAKLKEKNT